MNSQWSLLVRVSSELSLMFNIKAPAHKSHVRIQRNICRSESNPSHFSLKANQDVQLSDSVAELISPWLPTALHACSLKPAEQPSSVQTSPSPEISGPAEPDDSAAQTLRSSLIKLHVLLLHWTHHALKEMLAAKSRHWGLVNVKRTLMHFLSV